MSSYIDNRDLISSAIKISYPSGEATTLDFVLRADEMIDVEDLVTKVDLYANSIFFVKGEYWDDNRIEVGNGSYVRYIGSIQKKMSAKVICKQTGELVDEKLKSLDQNKYDIGVSGADYCGDAQPCCAIVLALPRGTSSYVSDSNNDFISSLISIIIIMGIPLLLLALVFVYRKKPGSLLCLTCVYSLPTFYMAQIVLYGLLFFFLGALRGFFDWGYFSSWVIIFDLAFFSSLTVLLLAFFVFKSKNMPIEKKLFWLKIFAVLAFFINLFMLFFLSISMLSD
ncbi:MAG: hypothetical protein WC462_00950 [archaeon]